jgi:hypothetical protein
LEAAAVKANSATVMNARTCRFPASLEGSMAISLNDLAANADVREQLRATCDFDLEGAGTEIGYAVEGVTEAAVVARDGAGGVFAVIARSSRVLFVSAEDKQVSWRVTSTRWSWSWCVPIGATS